MAKILLKLLMRKILKHLKRCKNSSITESSLNFIDEFNQIFISALNLQNNVFLDNISW